MEITAIFGLVIFGLVFVAITTEIINKTAAAIAGGVLFLILRFISQDAAFHSIDWGVIFLLVAMMIIMAVMQETGLFQYLAIKVAKVVKGEPLGILILLSLVTAVVSAFLDNVTTVLILTPITILIAVELSISPIPFVIALAVASNIGGTATLIGDPPNIMIGTAMGFTFLQFLTNLGPVVIIILAALVALLPLFFGKKMKVSNERKARIMELDETQVITDMPLLIRSGTVLVLLIGAFLLHSVIEIELATIAMAGASVLLLMSDKHKMHTLLQSVEWETILFFVGLFIMVDGLKELGAIGFFADRILEMSQGNPAQAALIILWFSGILSALVDNIPYVATMIPLVARLQDTLGVELAMPIWWSLALGACLGGNGTLIGASANVVASGIAKKSGYAVSFMEFTKYGAVVTVVSLVISTGYIWVRYLM